MTKKSVRKLDPLRRERIVDATLKVITKVGVANTTHRKVATAAKVPLGSVTYYFKDLDDLLHSAFSQFSEQLSVHYAAPLEAAQSLEEARTAVVDIICGSWANPQNMSLVFELYAYASRKPQFKQVMRDWMMRSRKSLGRHFDARTARALDAVVEGVSIHNSMDVVPISRAEVEQMVLKLTEKSRVNDK